MTDIRDRMRELEASIGNRKVARDCGRAAAVTDKLVEALRRIAQQKTTEELAIEYGSGFEPDYEAGYDMMICDARSALAEVTGDK